MEKITRLCDCSIRQFMRALFDKKYDDFGSEEEFEVIFTAYCDISGIAKNRQYEIMAQLHNIQARQNHIEILIDVQYKCFETFGQPAVKFLQGFQQYGHRISWDGDKVKFFKKLNSIDLSERRFIAERDKLLKELKKLSTEGVTKDSEAASRLSFVRMLNTVGQKNKINRDETDMEALALMIRDFNEEMMARAQQATKKRA